MAYSRVPGIGPGLIRCPVSPFMRWTLILSNRPTFDFTGRTGTDQIDHSEVLVEHSLRRHDVSSGFGVASAYKKTNAR